MGCFHYRWHLDMNSSFQKRLKTSGGLSQFHFGMTTENHINKENVRVIPKFKRDKNSMCVLLGCIRQSRVTAIDTTTSRGARIASGDRCNTSRGTRIASGNIATGVAKSAITTFETAEQTVEELRDIALCALGGAEQRTITCHFATRRSTCVCTSRLTSRSGTCRFTRSTGNRGRFTRRTCSHGRFARSTSGHGRFTRGTSHDGIARTTSIQCTRFVLQKVFKTCEKVTFLAATSTTGVARICITASGAILGISKAARQKAHCKRNNQKLGLHRTNSPFSILTDSDRKTNSIFSQGTFRKRISLRPRLVLADFWCFSVNQ